MNGFTSAAFITFFVMFLSGQITPSYSQTKIISDQTERINQHPDSLQVYPEKQSSEEQWEKIINTPGRLVFSPFKLTFLGMEEIVEEVDETMIIQRVIEYLSQYKPRGFSPQYSSRYGGGLLFYHKIPPYIDESQFDVSAQWGTRHRKRYRMRLKDLQTFGKRFSTDVILYYQFLSDESFFGKGNDSKYSDESKFAHKQTTVEASLKAYISKQTIFLARFGIDRNNIKNARTEKDEKLPYTTALYNEAQLPGLYKESNIARIQFAMTSNSLNKRKRPTAGGLLSIESGAYNDIENEEFGFWKLSGSYKHYIHLFYDRTILLRMAAERTGEFSGKKIPFYYLSELGTEETIRGFTRSRFYDKDMLLGSVEYNYPVWRDLIDAGLFADAGKVSRNILDEFSLNDFNYSYGGFFNIWGKDKIQAQIMIGRSKDRTRYYFSWNKKL
ncbi:MAG TPA: hypothetical protein ENH82_15580 [bacterium]|nr:hypothetical protein [bacterium]